jgi:hypothetical protein
LGANSIRVIAGSLQGGICPPQGYRATLPDDRQATIVVDMMRISASQGMAMGFWGKALPVMVGVSVAIAAPAAHAQVQTIDPNSAIDSDLNHGAQPAPQPVPPPVAQPQAPAPYPQAAPDAPVDPSAPPPPPPVAGAPYAAQGPVGGPSAAPAPGDTTYHENELVNAAEGVFGKGARGLALMIRDLLKKQGEPNAYITGSEGGGAFFVGLRYGNGTLHHKIEGQMPVWWTGPSLGIDFGGNYASTFVLVYNLHDTNDLFTRIGAGEGQAYLIGGFNVSYLRKGDLVVIPVRMGGGLRFGVNGGYMRFTHKSTISPF